MDSTDLLTFGMGLYLAGGFVVHRINLSRLQRYGLELNLLSRHWCAPIPEMDIIGGLLELADAAKARGAAGDVDREAHRALAEVRVLGGPKRSGPLAYLDAHIRLSYLVHVANIELVAFTQIFALRRALKRFGHTPALHLAMAHAQALLGQMTSAIDELGRAAFYAHGDRFFLDVVVDSGYVASVRPELYRTCQAQPEPVTDDE